MMRKRPRVISVYIARRSPIYMRWELDLVARFLLRAPGARGLLNTVTFRKPRRIGRGLWYSIFGRRRVGSRDSMNGIDYAVQHADCTARPTVGMDGMHSGRRLRWWRWRRWRWGSFSNVEVDGSLRKLEANLINHNPIFHAVVHDEVNHRRVGSPLLNPHHVTVDSLCLSEHG